MTDDQKIKELNSRIGHNFVIKPRRRKLVQGVRLYLNVTVVDGYDGEGYQHWSLAVRDEIRRLWPDAVITGADAHSSNFATTRNF